MQNCNQKIDGWPLGSSNQMRRLAKKTREKRAKICKSLQKCALFEQKLAEISAFWTTF